jgi:hypothetical protein
MVPPLRYRAEIVKALLVPDLGPIRPGRTPPIGCPPAGSWLIIINPLGLFLKAVPHPCRCHPCDFPPHALPVLSWPVLSCLPPRPLAPTAASSSLPTRLMVTASTSASPGATSAAPMPPAPTASHGNLHRRLPIAASSPTKLPARFRAAAPINARAMVVGNTSPSPASARAVYCMESRAGLPHGRPGNDVTLP